MLHVTITKYEASSVIRHDLGSHRRRFSTEWRDQPGEKMGIIVVATQKVICDSVQMIVRTLLSDEQIVQAGTISETLTLIKPDGTPPTIITGARMPDGYVADLMRKVAPVAPKARFVILTQPNELGYAREALKLGADALCLIDDLHASLPQILQNLGAGVVSMPARLIQKLLSDETERLTRREHEILMLLAEGLTNFQISARLGLSPNTIKYYLKAIYQKLDVSTRGGAIAKFVAGDF